MYTCDLCSSKNALKEGN